MSDHHAKVKAYYDINTRNFLRWGKNRRTKAIHQALWAEGVKNRSEAVNYSAELILKEIQSLPFNIPYQILDLGCGVGSSIIYLSKKLKDQATISGITISPLQVKEGLAIIKESNLAQSCAIYEGDYLNLPPQIQGVHLAYAIESFVHGNDPKAFFLEISERLLVGGKLILIDDFLVHEPKNQLEQNWIHLYKKGWLIGSLLNENELKNYGENSNLRMVAHKNLTNYMELGRPRDKAIGLAHTYLGKWMEKSSYWRSMIGGYAKQQCLKSGLMGYGIMVYEKF